MDFRQSFHYETAHVADTYKELLQIPLNANNSVLTNLIAQNKVSVSTNVSVKIQYLEPTELTDVTDLELIETMSLATTVTHSFMNTTFASTNKLGVDLHLPPGAKLFIKSSVLNALNIVATVKHYNVNNKL